MTARARANGIGDGTEFVRPAVGQRPTREERDKGKRKVRGSTLKVSVEKPQRYMDGGTYEELFDAVAKNANFICAGIRLGYHHECHWQFDACHLVDQQHLGENHPALSDPDICIYACRLVHNWIDKWHGPLLNVRERERLRMMAGVDFEDAVYRHGLQKEADRKIKGATPTAGGER